MWIALRPFRYRNVSYKTGDTVPAEEWSNRRAFYITRRIREVDSPAAPSADVPEAPQAVDPSKLKRGELNDYALSIGVDKPEGYVNRDALLAAVDLVLHPKASPSTVTNVSGNAVGVADDEVDPFADLNDDGKD